MIEQVIKVLENDGFTNITHVQNNFGLDFYAEKQGKKIGFLSTGKIRSIGTDMVQKVYSGKNYYGCNAVILLTLGDLTEEAGQMANQFGIIIWGKDRLEKIGINTKTKNNNSRQKKKRSKLWLLLLIIPVILVAVLVGGYLFIGQDVLNVCKDISSIGDISFESKDVLSSIQEEYNSLDESKKKLVFNYSAYENAMAEYESLFANINGVNNLIEKYTKAESLTQDEVDELNRKYDALSDIEKEQINKYQLSQATALKSLEKCAIQGIKQIRSQLKNPSGLELLEVTIKEKDTPGTAFVYIEYSGTNSFGARISDTATLDVTETSGDGFYALALISPYESANPDQILLLNFSQYLKLNSREIKLDPERLMNNL